MRDSAKAPLYQNDPILRYYRASRWDYELLWMSAKARDMHFGYWDETVKNHEASLLKMNEVLATRANILASDRVLDVGCGFGGSALWLARNIGCHVMGVNIVSEQIESAERLVRRESLERRVEFRCTDFTALDLRDESFDVVWAMESLLHFENREDFFRKAWRLLRENGRLVIADYVWTDSAPLKGQEAAMAQEWFEGWAMRRMLSAKEYEPIVKSCGFSGVVVEDISKYVIPSLKRLKNITRVTVPLATAAYALRCIPKERLGNARASALHFDTFKRGLWRYWLIFAAKSRNVLFNES